jgi:competence transcription factor ComK
MSIDQQAPDKQTQQLGEIDKDDNDNKIVMQIFTSNCVFCLQGIKTRDCRKQNLMINILGDNTLDIDVL